MFSFAKLLAVLAQNFSLLGAHPIESLAHTVVQFCILLFLFFFYASLGCLAFTFKSLVGTRIGPSKVVSPLTLICDVSSTGRGHVLLAASGREGYKSSNRTDDFSSWLTTGTLGRVIPLIHATKRFNNVTFGALVFISWNLPTL